MSTDNPADSLALLLRLSTNMDGTPAHYQYTTAQRPVTHTTLGMFVPLSALRVESRDLTGRADDEPLTIEMQTVPPLVAYGTEPSHAPVDVSLWLVDLTDPDTSLESIWIGRLIRLDVNEGQRRGICKLTVAGPKRNYQDRPLGIACTSACAWRFGDEMCGVPVDSLTLTRTVTSIIGLQVQLSSPLVAGPGGMDRWRRGFLRRGDLALGITENINNANQTMVLLRPPPSTWLNAEVTCVPGCDKTLKTGCRQWNNERRFMGLGYAMPSADPRTATSF